jgi:hypothetical protein
MTQRNPYARSRASRLAVEALESRDCPACTVFQVGGTVHVLGDGAANTVIIDEAPTSPFPPHLPGSLRINADGVVTEFPTSTVKRLDVQTRGGDDVVIYKSVIAPGADGVSSLSINLGAGNDVADFTVMRRTAAPARLFRVLEPDRGRVRRRRRGGHAVRHDRLQLRSSSGEPRRRE